MNDGAPKSNDGPRESPAEAAAPLAYAPPNKPPSLAALVVACGLATTLLALAGLVYLEWMQDLMGFYLWGGVPVGALIVGALAGSGYGLASWATGYRIRSWLLWATVAIQLVAFAGAMYGTFRTKGPFVNKATGRPVGFAEYVHVTTTSMQWEDGSPYRRPMGLAGYGVLALTAAGFAAGAALVPLGLIMKHPYCDLCLAYMKRKPLGVIRASAPEREVRPKEAEKWEAYAAEQDGALRAGMAALAELRARAEAGDAAGFAALLPPAWKEAGHLPRWVRMHLSHCKRCRQGQFEAAVVTRHRQKLLEEPLPPTPVSAEFVKKLLGRR